MTLGTLGTKSLGTKSLDYQPFWELTSRTGFGWGVLGSGPKALPEALIIRRSTINAWGPQCMNLHHWDARSVPSTRKSLSIVSIIVMMVPEAGPKESLHYYWYKYSKTPPYRSVTRLDSNGIPRVWGRVTGIVYRPGFVAMHGLNNLGHYLQSGNQAHPKVFLNQVDWLEAHAVIRGDGAVVWPHDFDHQESAVRLKAPWLSANAQGLVISALVRGWRITRRPRLLELLERSSCVFQLNCECNGVRVQAEEHIVYTEVPGLPAPGIMDGLSILCSVYMTFMRRLATHRSPSCLNRAW